MESRIHVITLAVTDLDRALEFYRSGLALDSPGVVATEFIGDADNAAGAIAMFRLDGGLILALYPRTELAKDAGVPFGPPKSGEFIIGAFAASTSRWWAGSAAQSCGSLSTASFVTIASSWDAGEVVASTTGMAVQPGRTAVRLSALEVP